MRRGAVGIAESLARGDIDAVADAVAEQWHHQRSLHPAITTPGIENIMRVGSRSGVRGGKALGASGGGCVLLIAHRGREQEVRDALAPHGEVLAFSVDTEGVVVES
jgi:D-glycero-alpha-D-manno-heptose-7-phosphate kinase